jgi:hypothetical protein
MRLRISVLGLNVLDVEISTGDELEFYDEEEEPESIEITPACWNGASQTSLHLETPLIPYDSDDRYRWEEEDRRRRGFGFR